MSGLTQVLGALRRLPGRPMSGKPLSQVIGTSETMRPALPWSDMMMLHHSPDGVSHMPPWCSVRPRSRSAGANGRDGRHAERFALHHALDRPRPVDRIGAGDHLIDRAAGDGGNVEVLALDLVEMVAFAHARRIHLVGGREESR